MSFGTLYTTKENSRSIAIKALAREQNLDIDIVYATLGNPSAEHRAVNQLGKIPTFVGRDGTIVSECLAVAVYFASQDDRTTLLGDSKQAYASILNWMNFFNTEILVTLSRWTFPLIGKAPYSYRAVEDARRETEAAITVVEEFLEGHTFLVGERISLADLFCAGMLYRGFQSLFGEQWRGRHPNVCRWYETITEQPIYVAVAPPKVYLQEPLLRNVPPK